MIEAVQLDFITELKASAEGGKIPSAIYQTLADFYHSYCHAIKEQGRCIDDYTHNLTLFLRFIEEQIAHPHKFESYHQRVTEPVDYYQFGLDFLRPVIIYHKSTVQGLEHVQTIEKQLAKGENVILLANHQTEPDPQAISLLLDSSHPQFAMNMIFVAGHRVTTDPLAVPFSLGRNLLCIYSKKHIEHEPETKQEKLLHNQRTMKVMGQLLAEGGKCIYVAPSGGRDRPDENGDITVAPFDPQSVEMFRLIAEQSGKATHFYPLSLATYALLPPPNSVEKELGEVRRTKCTPIHLAFGEEIDMDNIPGTDLCNKKELRAHRAQYIWSLVNANYANLISQLGS